MEERVLSENLLHIHKGGNATRLVRYSYGVESHRKSPCFARSWRSWPLTIAECS